MSRESSQARCVDHVRKFIEEEFVRHTRYRISLVAFCNAYERWCAMRNVVNRKLTALALLDHVEVHHGIVATTRHIDEHRSVLELAGIQFKAKQVGRRLTSMRGASTVEHLAWKYAPVAGRRTRTRR